MVTGIIDEIISSLKKCYIAKICSLLFNKSYDLYLAVKSQTQGYASITDEADEVYLPNHGDNNQYILLIVLYKIYQQTNLRLKPGTTLDILLKLTYIKGTNPQHYCFIQDDCFQTESKNLISSQPFTMQSADFISGSEMIIPIQQLSKTEHGIRKFDRTSAFTILTFAEDFYGSRLNEFLTNRFITKAIDSKDAGSKNKLTDFKCQITNLSFNVNQDDKLTPECYSFTPSFGTAITFTTYNDNNNNNAEQLLNHFIYSYFLNYPQDNDFYHQLIWGAGESTFHEFTLSCNDKDHFGLILKVESAFNNLPILSDQLQKAFQAWFLENSIYFLPKDHQTKVSIEQDEDGNFIASFLTRAGETALLPLPDSHLAHWSCPLHNLVDEVLELKSNASFIEKAWGSGSTRIYS